MSKDLRLLYVEDDENLRVETSKLFSHLFDHISTAEDGAEGLKKFQEETFDIVITDINMPNMNGVEMVQAIKEIAPSQPIVITSAHDESHYLLPLIDAGVDKYILKPISMQNMLTVLGTVCSNIQNEKLVQAYRHELEVKNEALIKNNEKLKKIIRILDTKIKQEAVVRSKNSAPQEPSQAPSQDQDKTEEQPPAPKEHLPVPKEPVIQTFDDYILDNDMAEMQDLEEDIDSDAVSLQLQSEANASQVINLGKNFIRYGGILSNYPVFSQLGHSIIAMGEALSEHADVYCENAWEISTLLESFFYVLSKWRTAIFEEGVEDPHMYDASLINDMETIIMILENKQDDIEGDIEFF